MNRLSFRLYAADSALYVDRPMKDDSRHEPDHAGLKRRTLSTLVIATIAFGIIAGAPNDASPVKPAAALIQFLVTCTLILAWCRLDADQRNFTLWRRFAFFTVAFPGPLVMVPLYLIKSRGRSVAIACLRFVGVTAALATIQIAAMLLGSFLGQAP